jgi:hypothetical protein
MGRTYKSLAMTVLFSILLLSLVSQQGSALQVFSGDRVTISEEISDDVFVSGGIIELNASVDGAIITGGTIRVSAPVRGDLIVAGGQIDIANEVEGKIVAAGGTINIRGNATNLLASGGNINLRPGSVIERDALLTGGLIDHAGVVEGKLTVRANEFLNRGESGSLDAQEGAFFEGLDFFINIVVLLATLGFIILGLVIIRVFPRPFFAVEERVRKAAALNTAVGFIMIIVSAIVILLLAISLVGLPIAAIMGMLFVIALMLSTVFVSYSTGLKFFKIIRVKAGNSLTYVVGAVILNILFRIPILDWIY